MKDHEKRELVSELVGIASIAHGTEQLRDRIAYALSGVFSAIDEVTVRAEKAEAELAEAQATLAKLRKQKPVAWCDGDGEFYCGEHYPNAWPTAVPLYAAPAPEQREGKLAVAVPAVPDDVIEDHRRLVRELDVLINGEDGAAAQASLCDIVAQVAKEGLVSGRKVPAVPDGFVLIPKKLSGDAIRKFTRAYNHGNSDFGAGWSALLKYLQSAPQSDKEV